MKLIYFYRLQKLNSDYQNLIIAQQIWPQLLSDLKMLYANFYNIMHKVSHNIVCGCCGIIGHNVEEFAMVSANDNILKYLAVESDKVPFVFSCRILSLDECHIMVDPLAIIDQSTLSVCQRCHSSLSSGFLLVEALANFRWIGLVPEELKDLTWVEEALIARSHLFGRIFRLEQRRNGEPTYSSLKGHIVLVSQSTVRLFDILPVSLSALADIAHVV